MRNLQTDAVRHFIVVVIALRFLLHVLLGGTSQKLRTCIVKELHSSKDGLLHTAVGLELHGSESINVDLGRVLVFGSNGAAV